MAVTSTAAASTQEKLLRARAASTKLALLSTEEKNALLLAIADAIESHEKSILAANRADVESSRLEGSMRDRLLLTPLRIKDLASGVRDVAALPDPIGETLAEWTKSNGLRIRKVRVPLGVVGIIYESRPNVTVDTAVLAIKAGNAIVLRGGKEAVQSSRRLVEIMTAVPGMPAGAIELLDSSTSPVGAGFNQGPRPGGRDHSARRRGADRFCDGKFFRPRDRDRGRELPHLCRRIGRLRNG